MIPKVVIGHKIAPLRKCFKCFQRLSSFIVPIHVVSDIIYKFLTICIRVKFLELCIPYFAWNKSDDQLLIKDSISNKFEYLQVLLDLFWEHVCPFHPYHNVKIKWIENCDFFRICQKFCWNKQKLKQTKTETKILYCMIQQYLSKSQSRITTWIYKIRIQTWSTLRKKRYVHT